MRLPLCFVFVCVCVCVSLLFVFVSVKLGKDVDNVGVGKFLRRLHCGQVDVGGGRAERKVASWVSAPPVRAVVLYYRAVREVYGRLNTHAGTTLPCLGLTLGPRAVWVSGCATLPLVPSWSPPSTQPGGGQRVEKKRVPGTYGVLSQITPPSSRYLFVASLKYTS